MVAKTNRKIFTDTDVDINTADIADTETDEADGADEIDEDLPPESLARPLIRTAPDLRIAPPPNPADGTIRITIHRTPQHDDSHLFISINGKEEHIPFDTPVDVHPSFYYVVKDSVQPVRVAHPNGTISYVIRPLYSYTVHADKRANKDKPL